MKLSNPNLIILFKKLNNYITFLWEGKTPGFVGKPKALPILRHQIRNRAAFYHFLINSFFIIVLFSNSASTCVYLDRQYISCNSDSYINGFSLHTSGNDLSYHYYCDKLDSATHRSRQTCITSTTTSTYDGDGKNYYLDRQTVDCAIHGARYFLNSFHLKRTSDFDHWYYEYTCCRVK